MTLIPRVDGLTFFDIDIQWSHGGTCDNYYVAITTDAGYQINRDFPYWESSGSRGSPNEIVAA